MNASGWLLTAAMCAGAFMPALGARTSAARRRLLIAGAAVALVIGSLAVRSATQPGEGFFPSDAGWAFLLIGMPLGAGISAAGLVLVLTKPTQLSDRVRMMSAMAALLGAPAIVLWRLVA